MINLYTTLAIFNEILPNHIADAIKANIKLSYVKKIYILTESSAATLLDASEIFSNKKVFIVEVLNRPTFNDFVLLINNHYKSNMEGMAGILNADISFRSNLDIKKAYDTLSELSTGNKKIAFALTRYDCVDGQIEQTLVSNTGIPNFISADCWLFNKEILKRKDMYYSLGQLFCDKFFNYDLLSSGYDLYNPCLDCVTIHHEMDLKTTEYYKELIGQPASKEAVLKHWKSSVNSKIGYYGILHVTTNSLLNGYLPSPLVLNQNKKKFYLFLKLYKASESTLLEIITTLSSKLSKYKLDIYLLVETDVERNLLLSILCSSKNMNCYIAKTKNIQNTFNKMLSGATSGASNVFCINDLSQMNTKVLSRFDSFFSRIDLKGRPSISSVEFNHKKSTSKVSHVFIITKYGELLEKYLTKLFFETQPIIILWASSISKRDISLLKKIYNK